MSRVFNVLFICTANSARSIMAEAILNQLGKGRFRAFSAGSHPAPEVHPMAIEFLNKQQMPTEGLRSKSWSEFAAPGAPALDFVLTVCDRAAGEVCPVWPGQPLSAHWGVEDPAAPAESPEAQRHAFSQAFLVLNRRIAIFQNLPVEKLDKLSLLSELQRIGRVREAD